MMAENLVKFIVEYADGRTVQSITPGSKNMAAMKAHRERRRAFGTVSLLAHRLMVALVPWVIALVWACTSNTNRAADQPRTN